MSLTRPANINQLINASKVQAHSANRLKHNADPYVGTIIGAEYAILEVIGEGGMARVYKAKQISVDRFVAIKILSTDEPESVARFASEVRIHGRLKHKNIVQALDCACDTKTGKTLFVMEYLNGLTLGELIRDTGTGIHCEQDIFNILTQLCDALEHAHNHGIIHRDLKPNNIVLLEEGENLVVKVVDFGIARVQEDMQRVTQAGVVVGSPGYMSPEHCKGKEPDRRADVYSLGAIAYALMTGRVPYQEPDLRSMMLAHCDPMREPPPIEETCPEIRGAKQLNAIIRKAMQTDRDLRFRSAGELKQAIIFWYGSVLNGDTQADLPVIDSSTEITTEVPGVTTTQQKSIREIVINHQQEKGTISSERWKYPELFVTGVHKEYSGEERHIFTTEKFTTISLSAPMVGRVILNKYKVLDVIGEGGMSVVYSAIDLRTRELVAIKTLKFAEPELSARFAREMQIHQMLRHPSIVRAIECLETQNQSFFVMEMLIGIVLEDYLDSEGRVDDLGDICTILSQILDAVEYAHDKGLVHRDLKPGNVIMFEEHDQLRVKVLDFGVVKIQEDLQKLTKAGVILGSPAYMSPEQCLGEDIDPTSDIYTLGLLAYELVTGRLPYANIGSELEWMEAHCDLNRLGDPVAVHRPGLPGIDKFDAVISKAMAKERTQRYQSIEQMKRDLDDWYRTATGETDDDAASPFSFDRRKTERIRAAILAKTVKESALTTGDLPLTVENADQLVEQTDRLLRSSTEVSSSTDDIILESERSGVTAMPVYMRDTLSECSPTMPSVAEIRRSSGYPQVSARSHSRKAPGVTTTGTRTFATGPRISREQPKNTKIEEDTFASELNKLAAETKPLRLLANISMFVLIASVLGSIVLFAMKFEADRSVARTKNASTLTSTRESTFAVEENGPQDHSLSVVEPLSDASSPDAVTIDQPKRRRILAPGFYAD